MHAGSGGEYGWGGPVALSVLVEPKSDGTILRALQRYAGTPVPVFAINFGAIGFLATVEPADIESGIARALGGERPSSGAFDMAREYSWQPENGTSSCARL